MVEGSDEREKIGFYAETYDAAVPDWPGEMDFYQKTVDQVTSRGEAVLELACGTGRVAIRLAQAGAKLVGLDISSDMLAVAGQKSAGIDSIRWVKADMRAFELEERFGAILIPGHAFHNLLTPDDQAACLACARRHLMPGGVLVVHLDHQDMGWLGDLVRDKGGVFVEEETFERAKTGRKVRALRAWSYERSTQTAICRTRWEELDAKGDVVESRDEDPLRLHCLFRFEVEHLLARVGFEVEATYGDFFGHPLEDASPQMIWVARRPQAGSGKRDGAVLGTGG
jgi:ubiquinone/menaquinone biosynthesis C-methylase UbiE